MTAQIQQLSSRFVFTDEGGRLTADGLRILTALRDFAVGDTDATGIEELEAISIASNQSQIDSLSERLNNLEGLASKTPASNADAQLSGRIDALEMKSFAPDIQKLEQRISDLESLQ